MAATTEASPRGIDATDRLDLDVIRQRAAEQLGIAKEDVSDQVLAETYGGDRSLWWRYRTQGVKPNFGRLLELSAALDLPIESFIRKAGVR